MNVAEIYVQDYIQVAHRLINLPGKCQNIHGHSMLVRLYLIGVLDRTGLIVDSDGEILDFSEVKRVFRNHLTAIYDHHLLLNEADHWARSGVELPGLTTCIADPTTENIAKWIANHMSNFFPVSKVTIEETATNGVTFKMLPEPKLFEVQTTQSGG